MKKVLFISAFILLLAASCQQQSGNNQQGSGKAEQSTSTSENNQNLPQGNKTGWNTYTNSEWKFGISYPNSFKVYTDADAIRTLAFIPPCDPTGLVCLFYSPDNHPKTNFEGAGISVSPIERRSSSAEQCRTAQEGEQKTGEQMINGVIFAVFKGGGAATGHSEEYRNYRAYNNYLCMEVTLRVTEANIENYPQGSTVKRFNKNEVWSKLEQVLSTFEFAGGDSKKTEGWKIYSSAYYGFEVKHPSKYSVEQVAGEMGVSATFNVGKAMQIIAVIDTYDALPLDDFVKAKARQWAVRDYQKTTFLGQPAYEGINLGLVSAYEIIVKNKGVIYEFVFNTNNKDSLVDLKAGLTSEQQQILSSFKFIK